MISTTGTVGTEREQVRRGKNPSNWKAWGGGSARVNAVPQTAEYRTMRHSRQACGGKAAARGEARLREVCNASCVWVTQPPVRARKGVRACVRRHEWRKVAVNGMRFSVTGGHVGDNSG